MGMIQTNNCIRKIIIPVFLYAAIILINGCQKTDINFGSQFVDNNYTQLIKVDTAAIQLATRFYDSVQTNGSGKLIAGIYSDPLFGTVKASSYLKLNPPTYNNDSDYTRATFDSLVLIIKPSGRYYGDTTKLLHLNVFRLAAPLQPTYTATSSSYYNFDTIQKFPTPLGGTDFLYYPANQNSDSAIIRLSDALGKQLLGLLQTKDLSIQNSTNFINFFEGICVSPGNSPATIINFSDSVVMRLYYQNPGVITYEGHKDFTFTDANNQFNNIAIDRTGTPLATVTPDVYTLVNSSITGNAAYMQAATGTGVKITFPNIASIQQIPNFIKVARAILVLKPVPGSYSLSFPLADSIRLTQTDIYNDNLGDLLSSAAGSNGVLIGTLTLDYLYGQNTEYTFDITNYINSLLYANQNYGYGLVASPPQPAFATRFYRSVFDNSSNVNFNSQLLVYYITVQ